MSRASRDTVSSTGGLFQHPVRVGGARTYRGQH